MNLSTFAVHFSASMLILSLGSVSGLVFWAYFASAAILAAGLFAARKGWPAASWRDRLVTAGGLFLAIAMAEFASQHFTETQPVSQIVPAWLHAPVFWTLFVGVALIAAALAMVLKIQARLAALLLALMLFLFVPLLHIPDVVADPRNVMMWAPMFRDMAFSGGALVFAEMQPRTRRDEGRSWGASWLVAVARIFVAFCALFFGAEHFLRPGSLPAVDLDQLTPAWIPLGRFWAYLSGAVFLGAGVYLAVNRRARPAALCLSVLTLLQLLFIYLPMVIAAPADIDNGLNYFVSTLAFCGVTLLLAVALPGNETARG